MEIQKLFNLHDKKTKHPKNILFVGPDSGAVATYSQYHAPPLGVMRLAGYLNSLGHNCESYDPNLYSCSNLYSYKGKTNHH